MKSFEQPPTLEVPTIVEEAKPEDAAGIAHVRNVTWQATYTSVPKEEIVAKDFEREEQVSRWRKAIENTEGPRRLWVAKEQGEVVGYSQGRKGEHFNEILGLYVLPDHEGKGLGSELLSRVIEWLGDEKAITLEAAEYADRAIGLYKKFGFVPTGEEVKGPSFASGATIPSIGMIRPARNGNG